MFTDAEEACLCGAEAFVSQHPLGADGGVVLNFEARGSTGPASCSRRPAATPTWSTSTAPVPHPVGTSFAVEVYRILPNDTDFTPFRDAGAVHRSQHRLHRRLGGLPHAGGPARYMDKASLQHHGDNALALARAFGDADSPR